MKIYKINSYIKPSFKSGTIITDEKSIKDKDKINYAKSYFVDGDGKIDGWDSENYEPVCDKSLFYKAVSYLSNLEEYGTIDLSSGRRAKKKYAYTREGYINYTNGEEENSFSKKPYHFFKKNTLDGNMLVDKVLRHYTNYGAIGSLPLVFIDSKDKNKRGELTKNICDDLGKFSEQVREEYKKNYNADYKHLTKWLQEKLSENTKKKCKLSYIYEGSFGITFKIECGKEKFVLKVPKNNGGYYNALSKNGIISESVNAIYLNEILPQDKCSRFYCADFDKGYMLTGLCEDEDTYDLKADIEEYEKIYSNNPWNTQYVINPDVITKGNKLGKKIVDYGGISYRFKNRSDAKYARLLFPLIEKRKIDEVKKFREKNKDKEEFLTFINDFFFMNRIPSQNNSEATKEFTRYQTSDYVSKFKKEDIEYLIALGAKFEPCPKEVIDTFSETEKEKYRELFN